MVYGFWDIYLICSEVEKYFLAYCCSCLFSRKEVRQVTTTSAVPGIIVPISLFILICKYYTVLFKNLVIILVSTTYVPYALVSFLCVESSSIYNFLFDPQKPCDIGSKL